MSNESIITILSLLIWALAFFNIGYFVGRKEKVIVNINNYKNKEAQNEEL